MRFMPRKLSRFCEEQGKENRDIQTSKTSSRSLFNNGSDRNAKWKNHSSHKTW